MANKLYEENDIAAIATAIRAKNGSSNTYTVSQMAPAINNIPSGGGGDIVNGIIRNYKAATSTIDANTFVEFVSMLGQSTDKLLASGGVYITAILIDTNKVLVLHQRSYKLYGVVCTISGTTITAGTDTQIIATSNSGLYISAARIDANKVFVAYGVGQNSIEAVVCTISGTTITAGTAVQVAATPPDSVNVAFISSGAVFVSHRGGTSSQAYLYGIVCTISGTTITVGTDTLLSDGKSAYLYASAMLVDTNKIFVSHRNNYKLYGVVCTISGTTITVGTDTQVANSDYYATTVKVATNKVFIAYGSTYLYGIVCTISGTTITAGTATQLTTKANSHMYISEALVDSNKVFIAHGVQSEALYGIVCTISGTTITVGTDTQLTTKADSYSYNSTALVETNKVFIAHQQSSNVYGMVITLLNETCVIASDSTINGLTKTTCTTSTAGQVWVLDN